MGTADPHGAQAHARAMAGTRVEAMPVLREAIAHCEKVADYISRELFEKILESEEEHVDWLETNLGLIEKMGLQNYVQLQSEPAEE